MRNFYRYPDYKEGFSPPNSLPLPPFTLSQRSASPSPSPPVAPANEIPEKKKIPPKKKFDIVSFKKDTCTSLCDVEHFLCNFSDFLKCVKLIKLLK